jgi:hypothetical protein
VEQLLSRLEADAAVLRRRLGELDDASANLGGAASPRRDELARDIEAARRAATQRLGTTVSAMENLRLDLLRMRTRIGTTDGLTEDLAALRDVADRVDAQIELESDTN